MQISPVVFLILGLFFGITGVVFLIMQRTSQKKTQKAMGWPVVSGTVINSELKEFTQTDIDDIKTATYAPVVEYGYQVLGQTFTSRRIAYGANRFDRKTAAGKVEQYPQGKTVEVHYNPKKPAESVLETTVAGGKAFQIVGYIFLAMALVCILIGVL